jgi:peptide/nickel transport system substrate-binding protein
MTDFSKPIGSGAYMFKRFEPGVKTIADRFNNDWNQNRGWFDSVEFYIINDTTARLNALLTKRVDAINRVDRRTVAVLAGSPDTAIVRSDQGTFYTYSMIVAGAPYSNNDVRLALKYAFDRDQMLNVLLQGYGQLGNDHPVFPGNPWCAKELPQRLYDPDKAKFHVKKAGIDKLTVQLSASDVVFGEAMDAAELFRQSADRAGIKLDVIREPADGYWTSVFRKKPFYNSYWSGRPVPDLILTTLFYGPSSSNESFWKSDTFDRLLLEARAEIDHAKRMSQYAELQRMASDEAGTIIPVFVSDLDARSKRLMGFVPDKYLNMSGGRLAERGWFAM